MLTKEHIVERLRVLKPELSALYGVQELALFGSYARGTATENSDIDIFVVLAQPKFEWLVGAQRALEQALGTTVDIVRDGKHLRESFRTSVRKEAVYV